MTASSTSRRGVSGLLMLALTGALFLPPAHVHLPGEDFDDDPDEQPVHLAPVEHSHWAPHHYTSRAAFEDNDGRVIYIDRPAVVRASHVNGDRPHVAVVALLAFIPPIDFSAIALRTGGNAVRAGPAPPAFHLRGPPVVL